LPAPRRTIPMLTALAAMAAATPAVADFTDFDTYAEGAYGLQAVTFDGIRFFDFNTIEHGIYPGPGAGRWVASRSMARNSSMRLSSRMPACWRRTIPGTSRCPTP
jgi:hypothetical protein